MARNVNSKALFDDMQFDRIGTSESETADTPKQEKRAVSVEKRVTSAEHNDAPAKKPHKSKKEDATKADRDSAPSEVYDSTMSEKKGFYLTKKNYEALKLRHTLEAESSREYSRIVNDALTLYLEKELRALEIAERSSCSSQERFYKALVVLMSS